MKQKFIIKSTACCELRQHKDTNLNHNTGYTKLLIDGWIKLIHQNNVF